MNAQLTTKEFKEKIRAIALRGSFTAKQTIEVLDQVIYQRDQYKAHAERLAEACNQAIHQIRQTHGKLQSDNQHLCAAQNVLREAIAQWEAQKQ